MVFFLLTKTEIMEKLIAKTLHNKYFDVDEWSEDDADTFEGIANLIRRELQIKKEINETEQETNKNR